MVFGLTDFEVERRLVQHPPCFTAVTTWTIESRDVARSRMRGLVSLTVRCAFSGA